MRTDQQVSDEYWAQEFSYWRQKTGGYVTKIFKDEVCYVKDGTEHCTAKALLEAHG